MSIIKKTLLFSVIFLIVPLSNTFASDLKKIGKFNSDKIKNLIFYKQWSRHSLELMDYYSNLFKVIKESLIK